MSDQVTISKRTLLAVAAVVVAALVALGVFLVVGAAARASDAAEAEVAIQERHSNFFRDAVRGCASSGSWGDEAHVRDGGMSLELDGAPTSVMTSGQWKHQECILRKLGAPESVLGRMQNTRALDGTQDAEWDDLIARWTYHPNNGLDVFIEFAG